MSVVLKFSFTVTLQLNFYFFVRMNKFTVIGMSQHGYITGKSPKTNLITYANEITVNLSGCP